MEITKTLKNGNIVTITTNVGSVDCYVNNQGTDDEYKSFLFSGIAKKNSSIKIGTLSISVKPNDNKRFTAKPKINYKASNRKLNLGSNLRAMFKSSTKNANNDIVEYSYDLMYVAKEKVSKNKVLKYKMTSPHGQIVTRNQGVIRVICGRYDVSVAGEKRKITIQGIPDSTFVIAFNKLIDVKDNSIDKYLPGNILSTTDENFLLGTNSTGGDTNLNKVLEGKIGKDGKYTFYQTIPKGDDLQRWSLDIKKTCLYTTKFSTKGYEDNRVGWNGYYSKILTQHKNPVLTLEATTTVGSNLNISINGATAVAFNSSNPRSTARNGYYNYDPSYSKYFDMTYVLTATSGAFSDRSGAGGAITFTNNRLFQETTDNTLGLPIFSNSTQSLSDWTNSSSNNNGGTNINIVNITKAISTVSSSNDTCTITFSVQVINWGKEDVKMSLNTASIVAKS